MCTEGHENEGLSEDNDVGVVRAIGMDSHTSHRRGKIHEQSQSESNNIQRTRKTGVISKSQLSWSS